MSTEVNEIYDKTRSYIFGKDFAELAFLVGVAIRHDILPPELKKRWLKFFRDEMGTLFKGDPMTDNQYTEINDFMVEISRFLMGDGGLKLTSDLIEDARKQHLKDRYASGMSYDSWRAKMKDQNWG